jgi:hypothetical protein
MSAKNHKNPAIKRIMADCKELSQHPSHRSVSVLDIEVPLNLF